MSLPNRITLARIALIPLMIAAFYLDEMIQGFTFGGLIAGILFVIAAATDFVDGHIARKYNMVTTTGKFLDPIADKILVVAALFLAVEGGLIAAPYGAIFSCIIVARELVISGFRQVAASKGSIISADKSGKIKAVFQDIAMVAFLWLKTFQKFDAVPPSLTLAYLITSYAMLVTAVILTLWSGAEYIIKNKAVLS